MTDHLNKLGVRESLAGLAEVEKALRNLSTIAETEASGAEARLMAFRQVDAFAREAIKAHRAALHARLGAIMAAEEETGQCT